MRATLSAVCLLFILVVSMASPASAWKPPDPDWWAPLSFDDYLKSEPEWYRTELAAWGKRTAADCLKQADEWSQRMKERYALTDEQAASLKSLTYEKELSILPHEITRGVLVSKVLEPLRAGKYDNDEVRATLNVYYTANAYTCLQSVDFWRRYCSLVGKNVDPETGKSAAGMARSASFCLAAYDPSLPGLARVEERLKYAKKLSEPSAHASLDLVYANAKMHMQPLEAELQRLAKKMDVIEGAVRVDKKALTETALQGVEIQVRIGLFDNEALWAMQRAIPDRYKGTWAQLPAQTKIPAE